MKPLNLIDDWTPTVPNGYECFRDKLKKFIPKAKTTRVLIVDDIDADGFGSAKIAKHKLSKIFPKCDIYINDRHGFYNLEAAGNCDVIFIVDSSSNLLESYKDFKHVFILDHHEYDHSQICPENVCFINSKDTEKLKNISAGMLTYLVLTKFLEDVGIIDTDLFDIACMTLYSDVVPLDDFVQSCLYKFMQLESYSNLLTSLNIYKDTINRNTLAYTIVPLINYTRRLGDYTTLMLLYDNNEELAVRSLLSNRDKGKNIIDIIDKMGQDKNDFSTFSYWDISFAVSNIPQLQIASFKGVYANTLLNKRNKPALVGYEDNENAYFSVRSSDIDSLSFFSNLPTEGGGHKSACGFKCAVQDLPAILAQYDNYLKGINVVQKDYIEIKTIKDLDFYDLLSVATMNEFRYSNYKPITFILRNVDQKEITNVDLVRYRFNIREYSFISYKPLILKNSVDIIITPVLSSFHLGTRKLIVEMKESSN